MLESNVRTQIVSYMKRGTDDMLENSRFYEYLSHGCEQQFTIYLNRLLFSSSSSYTMNTKFNILKKNHFIIR